MLMIAETSARNMTFLPISSPNMQPTLHISIAAVYSEEVSTTWETQRSKIEWQSLGMFCGNSVGNRSSQASRSLNYFVSFTVSFHLPQANIPDNINILSPRASGARYHRVPTYSVRSHSSSSRSKPARPVEATEAQWLKSLRKFLARPPKHPKKTITTENVIDLE